MITEEDTDEYASAPVTTRNASAYAVDLAFTVGWAMLGSYARLWGLLLDHRGWAALLLVAVAGTATMIAYDNQHM